MFYNSKDLEVLNDDQMSSYESTLSQIKNSKRLVLKFGTEAVTSIFDGYGRSFAEDVSHQMINGREIVIVSSGAIGLGKRIKEVNSKNSIIEKSIYASLGQPLLMELWRNLFGTENIPSCQVLYENENLLGSSEHIEYIKDGLEAMIHNKIIPIANENDAVTSEEIKPDKKTKSFGDNDNLARLLCELINADAMVFFTKSGGVYKDLNDKNSLYKAIFNSDEELTNQYQGKISETGSGGLSSKLKYSIELSELGIPVVIASSEVENCLHNALYRHDNHTVIIPKK